MLQQPTPDDFVLATGETHPVREFIEKSFNALDIQLRFAYLSLIRSPLPLTYMFLVVGGQEKA